MDDRCRAHVWSNHGFMVDRCKKNAVASISGVALCIQHLGMLAAYGEVYCESNDDGTRTKLYVSVPFTDQQRSGETPLPWVLHAGEGTVLAGKAGEGGG